MFQIPTSLSEEGDKAEVSPEDFFHISRLCFMAQRFLKIGNGKSEMGMQAMKMFIPLSEFAPPPSPDKPLG